MRVVRQKVECRTFFEEDSMRCAIPMLILLLAAPSYAAEETARKVVLHGQELKRVGP